MKAELKGLEHNIAPTGGIYNNWEFKPCQITLSIGTQDEFSVLKNLFDACWNPEGIKNLAEYIKEKNSDKLVRDTITPISKEFGKYYPGM